jgi:chorismate mutase / prephenate dehydrogenase
MVASQVASRESQPVGHQAVSEVRSSEIERLRADIDHVDAALLRLVGLRARLALKLAGLKCRYGLPLRDPTRERAILKNAAQRNQGPLHTPAVLRLFRLVIRETRRLEEENGSDAEPWATEPT